MTQADPSTSEAGGAGEGVGCELLRFSCGASGAGEHLNNGTPSGRLLVLSQRQQNYALVRGSKYAAAAEKLGKAAQ